MEQYTLSGHLKRYALLPLNLSLIWAAAAVIIFAVCGTVPGLIALAALVAYLVPALLYYYFGRPKVGGALVSFATEYGQIQGHLLKEFAIPYAVLDPQGTVLWLNEAFTELTGKEAGYRRGISGIFPELTADKLPSKKLRTECTLEYGDKTLQAAMQKVVIKELLDLEDGDRRANDNTVIALYIFDETEISSLLKKQEADRIVCGQLSIDNYDEVVDKGDDLQRSLLLALVDRKLTKYFTEVGGIIRKTEPDKYFFIMKKQAMQTLEDGHFSILEDVKNVNVGTDEKMTLSIGIGFGSESMVENAEAARRAIDLALGRGGDQVVIREGYNTRYFGGKTEKMEKYTRVKARVKALALKEILSTKDAVLIMGHKIPDADVLGAAVGIYRCAVSIGKPAHIVMDDPPGTLKKMVDGFTKSPEYGERMFISSRDAKEIISSRIAVVVVDTNKPSNTACEDLLRRTNTVIVLDHHRQGRDIIQNAVLSYIEPYASSASEMVAEVVQYFDEKLKLRPKEADALYGGIMIDTGNFLTRSGVRTFEAAAYLRRSGADVNRIRKLFRDSMDDVRAKSAAISKTEVYKESFAITVCDSEGLKDPTVIAAQTANELLSVVGIKASFALTDYNGVIYISARAIDEVNVQRIMERLGGGGHLNIAGAQLKDVTVDNAVRLLKETINTMQSEGEL